LQRIEARKAISVILRLAAAIGRRLRSGRQLGGPDRSCPACGDGNAAQQARRLGYHLVDYSLKLFARSQR
jgi:hypothetical protein